MSIMESCNNMCAGRFFSAPRQVANASPENYGRVSSNLNSSFNNVDQDLVSDGESASSSIIGPEQEFDLFSGDLIIADEEDQQHQYIKQRFLSWFTENGMNAQVKAVHKNAFSSLPSQAKLQVFAMMTRLMEKKNEGSANVKYAWFGGSKDEINSIFEHGFGQSSKITSYGHGVYLSPFDSPFESFQSCVVDEDGLSHLVLCRVILGRMELVRPGSAQDRPSSKEFDSGVDNLSSPQKFIVWDTYKNTHILPQFVISFRCLPNLNESPKMLVPTRMPSSPWMPFPVLINELAKYLPQNTINLLWKHYGDLRGGKIPREEMIRKVRRLGGDDLLVKVIKSFKIKTETSKQSPSSNLNLNFKRIHGTKCVCSKKSGKAGTNRM